MLSESKDWKKDAVPKIKPPTTWESVLNRADPNDYIKASDAKLEKILFTWITLWNNRAKSYYLTKIPGDTEIQENFKIFEDILKNIVTSYHHYTENLPADEKTRTSIEASFIPKISSDPTESEGENVNLTQVLKRLEAKTPAARGSVTADPLPLRKTSTTAAATTTPAPAIELAAVSSSTGADVKTPAPVSAATPAATPAPAPAPAATAPPPAAASTAAPDEKKRRKSVSFPSDNKLTTKFTYSKDGDEKEDDTSADLKGAAGISEGVSSGSTTPAATTTTTVVATGTTPAPAASAAPAADEDDDDDAIDIATPASATTPAMSSTSSGAVSSSTPAAGATAGFVTGRGSTIVESSAGGRHVTDPAGISVSFDDEKKPSASVAAPATLGSSTSGSAAATPAPIAGSGAAAAGTSPTPTAGIGTTSPSSSAGAAAAPIPPAAPPPPSPHFDSKYGGGAAATPPAMGSATLGSSAPAPGSAATAPVPIAGSSAAASPPSSKDDPDETTSALSPPPFLGMAPPPLPLSPPPPFATPTPPSRSVSAAGGAAAAAGAYIPPPVVGIGATAAAGAGASATATLGSSAGAAAAPAGIPRLLDAKVLAAASAGDFKKDLFERAERAVGQMIKDSGGDLKVAPLHPSENAFIGIGRIPAVKNHYEKLHQSVRDQLIAQARVIKARVDHALSLFDFVRREPRGTSISEKLTKQELKSPSRGLDEAQINVQWQLVKDHYARLDKDAKTMADFENRAAVLERNLNEVQRRILDVQRASEQKMAHHANDTSVVKFDAKEVDRGARVHERVADEFAGGNINATVTEAHIDLPNIPIAKSDEAQIYSISDGGYKQAAFGIYQNQKQVLLDATVSNDLSIPYIWRKKIFDSKWDGYFKKQPGADADRHIHEASVLTQMQSIFQVIQKGHQLTKEKIHKQLIELRKEGVINSTIATSAVLPRALRSELTLEDMAEDFVAAHKAALTQTYTDKSGLLSNTQELPSQLICKIGFAMLGNMIESYYAAIPKDQRIHMDFSRPEHRPVIQLDSSWCPELCDFMARACQMLNIRYVEGPHVAWENPDRFSAPTIWRSSSELQRQAFAHMINHQFPDQFTLLRTRLDTPEAMRRSNDEVDNLRDALRP